MINAVPQHTPFLEGSSGLAWGEKFEAANATWRADRLSLEFSREEH